MNIIKSQPFKKIYMKMRKKPWWISSLLFFVMIRVIVPLAFFIIFLPFLLFFDVNYEQLLGSYPYRSLLKDLIFAGCVGPIIETVLFQRFLIWIFHRISNCSGFASILFSGIIFGLLHTYSVLYLLFACMIGIVFAFGYILYEKIYGSTKAILLISSIHALNNTSSILLHYLSAS